MPAPSWNDLNGDAVAGYSWAAAAGLSISGSTTSATVVITGGTAGVDYALTCTITTASGQIDARVITVQVRDR